MSLRPDKIIGTLTRLAAVGAGMYAAWLGADPGFVFVIIATTISEPATIEHVVPEGYVEAEGYVEDDE